MFTLSECWQTWCNIFFLPENATSLGLCRIIMGITLLLKAKILWNKIDWYFGPEGFYPYNVWKGYGHGQSKLYFSLFHYLYPSLGSAYLIFAGYTLSSFSLMIGWYSSLSAFLVLIFWVSMCHRNIYTFNSGDSLVRLLLAMLVFSGCGEALSLDNYLVHKSQIYNTVDPWLIRIMQITCLSVYLQSFYWKMNSGDDWRNGWGLYYSLNNRTYNKWQVTKHWSPVVAKTFNYMMLAAQPVFGLGLWFEETNAISLVFLVFMHTCFEIMMRLAYFSGAMICCISLFIDPTVLAKFLNEYFGLT